MTSIASAGCENGRPFGVSVRHLVSGFRIDLMARTGLKNVPDLCPQEQYFCTINLGASCGSTLRIFKCATLEPSTLAYSTCQTIKRPRADPLFGPTAATILLKPDTNRSIRMPGTSSFPRGNPPAAGICQAARQGPPGNALR